MKEATRLCDEALKLRDSAVAAVERARERARSAQAAYDAALRLYNAEEV